MVLLALAGLSLTGCTAAAMPVRHTSPPATPASTATPHALPTHLDPPKVNYPVLATAAGASTAEHGTLRTAADTLLVTIVCQGDGFPTIHTSDGFTANSAAFGAQPPKPGAVCSQSKPVTSSYGIVDVKKYGRMRYTVTPHGRIRWAVTFASQG